jgi:large subunit ribosomal protein LP2
MRYVAAYLLATLGGNEQPSTADIKKILSSVGIETDAARAEDLIAKLSGKNIESVLINHSFHY